MKKKYLSSLLLGMVCLCIHISRAQNILFDGDFSVTTQIVPFDTPQPPILTWAYWENFNGNGSQANPVVVDGVVNFQIINPGDDFWNVQLAQWGFPLIQGNTYQLSFDVRADSYRSFGVFLGEDGGNYSNLIGYDRYFYSATPEWQTISIEFVATSVFDLHKLSFEFGTDITTTYLDNILLQDLGPAPPDKVVIAGTFQNALNCDFDWDPNCDFTQLTFEASTGLYSGAFIVPEGNHRYKVAVGGSWLINYGENGEPQGPDIFLCVSSGEEEITFTYDPSTHLVSTSPVASGFSSDCLPLVVLAGSFQDELGCFGDWVPDCTNTALTYNPDSGLFEGDFNIPSGCYDYRVVLENSWQNSYGQEGIYNASNYILYIPTDPDVIHFAYDPVTHIVTSSPYSGNVQELTNISLIGSLQDELGCGFDYDYQCYQPALLFNAVAGVWEGTFNLPAGCYSYRMKESFGCEVRLYGENGVEWGEEIKLYVPEAGEVTFTYDPETHLIITTPYSGAPQDLLTVSLVGSLQDELGCASDSDFECDNPALTFNPDTGAWEGSFTLPAGCYFYMVKEASACGSLTYGENQLYVPLESEISFSYDATTHVMTSTPYSGTPQEVTKVSLFGSLQDEMGCTLDYDYECDNSSLVFNPATGTWDGSFNLPAGCYAYRVKERFGCIEILYGENGEYGTEFQLYVPEAGEITFMYDPQTHSIQSSPYSDVPQELTKIFVLGTLQDEIGCSYDYEEDCENAALVLNPDSGIWEGTYSFPAGCYFYRVKEVSACTTTTYGEDGFEWANPIQLFVPQDAEVSFRYDPQTHLMSTTPYSGAPQEVTSLSLVGSLQDGLDCNNNESECGSPTLEFNPVSGAWEGSFNLSAGCYYYMVKEIFGCDEFLYGKDGILWGEEIRLYISSEAEISFSYDPQTHIIISTPYSGVTQEITEISLFGTLQDELGCDFEYNFECDNTGLEYQADSGLWEGSFMLPAGCYSYWVKETNGCDQFLYGEDGLVWENEIQLYVPEEGVISFSYDAQTHMLVSTPHSGVPQEVTTVSLMGNLQDELGCSYDYNYDCNAPALVYDSVSGMWEGSFNLPEGCYTYRVKETSLCNSVYYGEDGNEWAEIQLYVPAEGEISFSYDPQTHLLISSPYSGVPQELTSVSLTGSLQNELGCAYDGEYECDQPALEFNPASGMWEGSFLLPAGCYSYWVKEIFGCNVTFYGEDGIYWGELINFYVAAEGEISFSYDPQTHIIISTPFSEVPAANICPEDIYVTTSPGACEAVVNYAEFMVTAFCGGDIISVSQTEGLPSGAAFPIGITTNTYLLINTTGEEITCSFDVTVTDTEAPVILDLNENYEPLWPPNHKMVPVFIDYVASDTCGLATITLSISSNEPETGSGKGDKSPDWEIVDDHNVLLRAERFDNGAGREYYITIKVMDHAGNFTEEVVTVRVPHDKGQASQEITSSQPDNGSYLLYPNAADAFINIKGPKPVSNSSYAIYDMLGVMKKQGAVNENQVEVRTLPGGAYILRFETEDGFISRQFIKN